MCVIEVSALRCKGKILLFTPAGNQGQDNNDLLEYNDIDEFYWTRVSEINVERPLGYLSRYVLNK